MSFLDQVLIEDENLGINNQMNDITTIIEAGKMSEMDLQAIIQNEISEWESSEERKLMLVGERYYRNKPDILKRERKVVGESGALEPVQNLANNKLVNAFTRKLVIQKVAYLLAKPMSIRTTDEIYENLLNEYFDKKFLRLIQNLGKEAINKGIAWLHVYFDETGKLSFMKVPSEQCIPIWKDAAHTELSALIRFYQVEVYEGRNKKDVRKVEWWDTDGVKGFVQDGGNLIPDVEMGEHAPNALIVKDGQEKGLNFTRIPFIPFKYNDDEMPLIENIKSLVDDYDARKSDNSNNLEDLPNSIFIVKNYGNTDGSEFRKNVSIYRVVFTEGDGGVDTVSIDIDTEAYKTHQEQNRRDIFTFGGGVDTQSEGFISDKSGAAIRAAYADLDLDCNMMETEFQASLEQLLWFIDVDINKNGKGEFFDKDVEFIFNRDSLINENAVIQALRESVGILSEETLVAQHPWVTDVQEELERKRKEKEEYEQEIPFRFEQGLNNNEVP